MGDYELMDRVRTLEKEIADLKQELWGLQNDLRKEQDATKEEALEVRRLQGVIDDMKKQKLKEGLA